MSAATGDDTAVGGTGRDDESPGRRLWRTLETLHACLYFLPEQFAAFEELGVNPAALGYFPLRAAPMGAVPAELVAATFFNFNPDIVAMIVPGVWDRVGPDAWVTARFDIVDRAYRRMFGDEVVEGDDVAEAAALARTAAEVCGVAGRPLYAANAALAWPGQPHLDLFHAATLLREWRGDAHVALLVEADLSAPEALVLHAATGAVSGRFLRNSRGWSREQWGTAEDGLRARGWLDEQGRLTDAGEAAKRDLEDRTDALSEAPAERLGTPDLDRLTELVRPLRRAIAAAGTFGAASA